MSGIRRLVCMVYLAIAIAFVLPLRAQDYKFSHISVEQGLSQTVVNCIMQDQQGFMWFGTQEGLNRYDGYNFKIYKRDPQDSNSLANNFIYTIFQSKDGIIWIGTNGNGLDRFDPITETFTHFPYDENNPASISSNSVRFIFEDSKGQLWVGTDDGLNIFDRATQKFTRFVSNPNDPFSLPVNRVFDIKEDKTGNIWIATFGKGICKYDPVTRKFHSFEMSRADVDRLYPKEVTGDPIRVSQCNLARSLLFYDDDRIWIGSDGCGVQIFNTKTGSFEKILTAQSSDQFFDAKRIFGMCTDEYNNIWLAVYDLSLDIVNLANGEAEHYTANEKDPYAFASDQPKCIYRDRQGNMWCGTNGKGVQVYFKSTSIITHLRRSERPGVGNNTLMSSAIMCVMEDSKGEMWIGTDGGGVTSYNRKTNKYTQHPELSTAINNSVLAIFESSDHSLWVGTYGDGLIQRKPDGTINTYSPGNQIENGTILTITEDTRDHTIWFGTFGDGVYQLNPKNDSLRHFTMEGDGLPSDFIYTLYFDHQNNLWIGTRGAGIAKRHPSGKIIVYNHDDKISNSLSNDMVYCFSEDDAGTLWISTANGLNHLDAATGTFTTYYERNGLPSDNIYAIVPDNDGFLWLSHNKGLTRFKPNPTSTEKQFVNYGPAAGVQPSEFNQGAYGRNSQGLLFFGGQKGLNIIDITKLKSAGSPAPVFVTSYKRYGTEIELDSTITSKRSISVTWRENYFSFEAAILDFVDPEKNMYQYKLEGFDDDWSAVTTNRFISYTNLPGGNFTLRIRAADSNGNWNEEGISIHITVEPPWWKTNWFYTLCAITIIGSVIGFTRYRTAAIKKENKILEARVAERTQELAQKNADITASIQYAKRIQAAVLPELDLIYRHLPNSFVFYRPKDIVSGDFYWFAEKDGKKIMVCADCTGHGVPGALMSVIGHNLLNQIILEKGITNPEEILNRLNMGVMAALKQGLHGDEDTRDGMDIAICVFAEGSRELKFAGALRPLVLVRKGIITKIDSDRFPIGGNLTGRANEYTLHKVILEPDDMLFMFSDGFADQFGGARGKKFMVKNLLELLLNGSQLPLPDQAAKLEEAFDNWKENYAQVDDVLVIGIRV
jgi:ligand-binding sensor domain-containing protein/serine phosphatase RsbU (regulator of sigma subunit)